ncbi:protein LAX PANICLE 2-like [Telopea speciosissima]|uniref:protein LAX PANICLE 2-like n=1 Tax=Telopea speciosissima TaxID=54955 RepID=UPI001CC3D121|nr:protein LAX PANICLE 2-like [Telopea speciosissima]
MTMVPVPTTLFNQQHYDDGGGGAGGSSGGVGVGIGIGGGACGDCFATGGSFGHLMNQIAAGGYEYGNPCSEVEACIGSDPVEVGAGTTGIGIAHNHMAEDESRSSSSLNEAGSSSKGGVGVGGGSGSGGSLHQEERGDEGWLQLGIGGASRTDPKLKDPLEPPTGTRRPGLVELDLLTPGGGSGGGGGGGRGGSAQQHMVNKAKDPIFCTTEFRTPRPPIAITPSPPPPPPPLFLQHQFPNPIPRATSLTSLTSLTGLSFPHQPEFPWGYNRSNPNPPWTTTSSSSPSSSSATPSSSMLPVPYFARHPGLDLAGPSSSSSDIRVIDAPPRPHSGIWFVLQASQNQAKEPFLAQITKTFLRIKDGRMTVRLLMKYVVNKLRLDNESEVEIRCRGQELLPFWTLQHVRDTIWRSRDSVTLLPDSSAADHVMILQYGRSP